jgi:CheY-like chemotaxis protein
VLIVEDNPDAADALSDLLQLCGYDTRVAYDGRSAIAAADSFQPAAVLVDLELPDMDGSTLRERLQELPSMRGARFIALTGRVSTKAIEREFHHYLLKPPSLDDLRRVLS